MTCGHEESQCQAEPAASVKLATTTERKHQVQCRSTLELVFSGCSIVGPISFESMLDNLSHTQVKERTSASHQRSTVAARVGYPLSPRLAP